MHAMNEMSKQRRRLQTASAASAEERQRKLQVAEADAEAAALQGREVAQQCAAIIRGLGPAGASRNELLHAFGAQQRSKVVEETGAVPLPAMDESDAEELDRLLGASTGGQATLFHAQSGVRRVQEGAQRPQQELMAGTPESAGAAGDSDRGGPAS